LFGYNSLKWDRRIEPVRYREARKQYAETMELVAAQAANYFFSLALAQTNLEIAQTNQAAADTLYRFALGRYHIGTITENELLQLEVSKLNEETNVLNAQIALDNAADNLRSYLNIKEAVELTVVADDSVPQFTVPIAEAMALAIENNPDIEYMQRQRLQGESNLAYAKANAGLKASIYMQLGLAQTGDDLRHSYNDLLDEQYVSVSVSLPILDWGKGRGQVRVARSNLELVNTQMEQRMIAFEQNVQLVVKQFNLQARRVDIAHRTMQTAAHRYDVACQLYIMGKSTILDLNSAISEKDSAYRNYISSLATYWSLYYTLRSLTRYDFQYNMPLEYQYSNIEKN
ncbi:MAG: TolC family protein, partial [Bacteroidaceae bacterium]|nr:TolC family protein [Bacteroidaceae bacterium]